MKKQNKKQNRPEESSKLQNQDLPPIEQLDEEAKSKEKTDDEILQEAIGKTQLII